MRTDIGILLKYNKIIIILVKSDETMARYYGILAKYIEILARYCSYRNGIPVSQRHLANISASSHQYFTEKLHYSKHKEHQN